MKRSHLVPARILPFTSIILLLLTLAACAKPPDAELAAAQKAVNDLSRIEYLARNQADKMHATLTAATSEVQAQKAKTFPSYTRAQQLLADVMKQAQETKVAAIEGARSEARAGLPLAQKVLAEARNRYASGVHGLGSLPAGEIRDQQIMAAMTRATKGKDLKAELDEFGKMLEQAKKDIDADDPLAAIHKIATVLNECERYYPYIVDQIREPMRGN